MNKRRRIEALRNLAERPGTEAEGRLAREKLVEAEHSKDQGLTAIDHFREYLRAGSMESLADSLPPTRCACGTAHDAFTECPDPAAHLRIDSEKRVKFAIGSRVYYNRWAYPLNASGTLVGYGHKWNRVRIKFDALKSVQSIIAYSAEGWHLSSTPVNQEDLGRTRLSGFTDEERCVMLDDLYSKLGIPRRL